MRIYTGAANGWQNAAESAALGTEGNPADSAEAIKLLGTTNGLYYINTPDGGVQQVYCMFTSGSSQVEIMDGCLYVVSLKMLRPLLETQ